MSKFDSLLESYRAVQPSRNLHFLEQSVTCRLQKKKPDVPWVVQHFGTMQARFAAILVAVFVGTGSGFLPDSLVQDTPPQADFYMFSSASGYLPSALLNRYE
jgi:hypothetical protein